MPKKKPLPDYSKGGFSWGHEYFSESKTLELKELYKFKEDYDLHSELNCATEPWQMLQDPGDQPTAVRRQELKILLKRATDLHESLHKMGRHAGFAIIRADSPHDPRLNVKALSTLQTMVRKLMWTTNRALESLADAKRGRRSSPEADFILNLRRIYLAGTGQRDKVTRNPMDDSYSGTFFEFLRECLSVLSIKKGDSRIAALAQEAAKADDLMAMNEEEFEKYLKSATLEMPD